ncbi:Uncharacterised protein [Sphingobacterium multivorum]|uniref:Uncharacterized protein n=2 Tax=Sphingobacterium multivorum TaxID=28454 RepID=A0A2X2JE42_SPHMU|nr:Uncharacterised protein [Sphingobacterium multivorum]
MTTIVLATCMGANAQETDQKSDKRRADDLKNFMTKVLGTKTDVPKGGFIFDISKSPELLLNVPVIPGVFNQLYFDGKVASSNDFTPLVKNGAWLPDLGVNLNFNQFFLTTTKFYVDSIKFNHGGNVEEASINEASQIVWLWLNTKAGYNYATLETYNNDLTLLNKDKFSKENLNSFVAKTDLNLYFFPSRRYLKFFSIMGKAGFEYKTNDHNYSSLKSVNIKNFETITDGSGKSMEVSSDTKRVKEGKLIVKNSASINYNLMTLFSISKTFYIGLSTYGKQTLTKDLKSLDAGFGVTVPVTKNEKDIASLTLKYEIPDIKDNISNIPVKDKGILGFSIGVPINPFGRH